MALAKCIALVREEMLVRIAVTEANVGSAIFPGLCALECRSGELPCSEGHSSAKCPIASSSKHNSHVNTYRG